MNVQPLRTLIKRGNEVDLVEEAFLYYMEATCTLVNSTSGIAMLGHTGAHALPTFIYALVLKYFRYAAAVYTG